MKDRKAFYLVIVMIILLSLGTLTFINSASANSILCPPTPTDTVMPSPTPTDTEVPSPTSTDTEIPSPTPTDTNVPTGTPTLTPTSTFTPVPTNTPTLTSTYKPTPTNTSTPPTASPTYTLPPPPTASPTYTLPPTRTHEPTKTVTPTSTQTFIHTPTITQTRVPTVTQTRVPTLTPTSTIMPSMTPTNMPTVTVMPTVMPTSTPQATSTPYPPKPAIAYDMIVYPGDSLGEMVIGKNKFTLYQGVNAPDGSLMLPTTTRGAALYQNIIWVHRLWKVGWLDIKVGSTVTILGERYEVINTSYIDYGIYPQTDGSDVQYIATCYADKSGKWLGVELYRLELIHQARHWR